MKKASVAQTKALTLVKTKERKRSPPYDFFFFFSEGARLETHAPFIFPALASNSGSVQANLSNSTSPLVMPKCFRIIFFTRSSERYFRLPIVLPPHHGQLGPCYGGFPHFCAFCKDATFIYDKKLQFCQYRVPHFLLTK